MYENKGLPENICEYLCDGEMNAPSGAAPFAAHVTGHNFPVRRPDDFVITERLNNRVFEL
jgi:hypothetical protein